MFFSYDIDITTLKENTVLLIDEASMVSNTLYEKLLILIKNVRLKIIFFGDVRQLPPINEVFCPMIKLKNQLSMNQNQRTKYPDLLNLYSLLSKYVDNEYFNKEKFENVLKNNKNAKMINKRGLEALLIKLKEKKRFIRVLCYTNKRKKYWNNKVRQLYYGDNVERIKEDECLIAKNFFKLKNNKRKNQDKFFITSKSFYVKSLKVVEQKYGNEIFKCYEIITTENDTLYKLFNKTDKERFDNIKRNIEDDLVLNMEDLYKEYENSCADNVKNLDYETFITKKWDDHFCKVNEINCPLDYSYCLTIHKSQGSTYDIVFIDLEDIMRTEKRDKNLMVKLLYTATTRASKNVYYIT
jgi:hypothetical protein